MRKTNQSAQPAELAALVEVIKEGDRLALRPCGKNRAAYFDSETRGSLPARRQPPLDERDRMR